MSSKGYTTSQLLGRALLGGIGGYIAALIAMIGTTGILVIGGLHRADATLIAAMLAYGVWVLVVIVCFSPMALCAVATWLFRGVSAFTLLALLARWAGLFD